MGSLIDKGKVVDKISDLFLDKYEAKANSDLTGFFKEVLKILVNDKGQSGWISVSDSLPKDNELVICATTDGIVRLYEYYATKGYNKPHFWNGALIADKKITHWMPFPEPPQGENDG